MEFTSTDLKRHTGVVINEVFTSGTATVKHRDRGTIYMLSETEYLKLKESQNATK